MSNNINRPECIYSEDFLLTVDTERHNIKATLESLSTIALAQKNQQVASLLQSAILLCGNLSMLFNYIHNVNERISLGVSENKKADLYMSTMDKCVEIVGVLADYNARYNKISLLLDIESREFIDSLNIVAIFNHYIDFIENSAKEITQ